MLCDPLFLRRRKIRNMPRPITASAAIIPTAMPAFAPVERPELVSPPDVTEVVVRRMLRSLDVAVLSWLLMAMLLTRQTMWNCSSALGLTRMLQRILQTTPKKRHGKLIQMSAPQNQLQLPGQRSETKRRTTERFSR